MRTVIMLSIVCLLLAAGTRLSLAQAPPPPQRGDIVWTFAQEPPLFDSRVAMALAALMDPQVQAAAGTSARIVAVMTFGGPDFAPLALPARDVPLLLRAAGFPQSPPFFEIGQCRVWAASAAGPPGTLLLGHVAPILGQALSDALRSLGTTIQPCVTTARPEDAHVLVWVNGGPPPPLPRRPEPTFLAWQGYRPSLPASLPPTGARLEADTPVPVRASLLSSVVAALTAMLWRRLKRTRPYEQERKPPA